MTKTTSTGWSVCCEYWAKINDEKGPEVTYHCYDGISPLNQGKEGGQCSFPETFMLNRDSYNKNYHTGLLRLLCRASQIPWTGGPP